MKRAAPAVIVLALALLPLLGMEPRVYLTLTVAGLAMGMLIFLVASGLTLIFGLMDSCSSGSSYGPCTVSTCSRSSSPWAPPSCSKK